jgi:hypothetical protein
MDESSQELAGLPERDEGREGKEGKTKDHRNWRLSATTKHMHGSLRQVGTKMVQTLSSNIENEAKFILLGRHQSKSTAAFLECRESLSLLHLAQHCKMRDFMIYKQASTPSL